MNLRYTFLNLFFLFFCFMELGFSQTLPYSDDDLYRDVYSKCSNSKYVFDGYVKNTYCYLSSTRFIYTLVKFQIVHSYKGNLKEGEVYVFEPDVDGFTQDGSNVGKTTLDGYVQELDTRSKNIIVFCNEYLDSTVLPPNTNLIQNHLLFDPYIIETYTENERKHPKLQIAGRFGPIKFYDVDSLYGYLNSIFPFIEIRKIEPHLPPPPKEVTFVDTGVFINGGFGLYKPASYPGGKDSLKKFFNQNFDWKCMPIKYRKWSLNVKFCINKNGEIYNANDQFITDEAVIKEIKRVFSLVKNIEPAVYQDKITKVLVWDSFLVNVPMEFRK